MELTPLLLLPLVGGYAFSSIWNVSRYITYREDGHRLYFRAVFYAVFILIISSIIHIYLFVNTSFYQDFLRFIGASLSYSETQELWSAISKIAILSMTVVLGPVLAHTLNLPRYLFMGYKVQDYARWLSERFRIPRILSVSVKYVYYLFQAMVLKWETFNLDLAIRNNDFEKLMARSVYKSIPILFTLDSGKVYVGWAVRVPNPIQERKSVRILPLLSGYRDADTQEVVFTTSYHAVLSKVDESIVDLNHLENGDFEIVLPTSNICSCHLFDPVAYSYFQNREQQSTKEPA